MVAATMICSGTQTGPYRGIPPSGKLWTTEGIVIDRIQDGKIAESWEVTHNLGLGQK